jgi:cell wall-associated NlpC family hydrolase
LVSLQAESNKNIADLGKQRTAQDPLIAQYKADIAAATTASTNAKAQVDVVNGKITAQKNAEAAAAAQEAAAAAQAAATAAAKPVASAPATTTTASANTAPVSINRGQVKVSIPATTSTENSTANANVAPAPKPAPKPTPKPAPSAASGSVISYAEQFIGVPYVWGGTSPNGFDCSGFVQYVYAHFGVSIDRTSQAQFGDGVAVSQSDLQPGDLVFFHDDGSGPGHVGMYIGGGNIIHAPHTGATVTIVPLSYMNGYCGARRVR